MQKFFSRYNKTILTGNAKHFHEFPAEIEDVNLFSSTCRRFWGFTFKISDDKIMDLDLVKICLSG
jgi:hypothetical protein